MKLALYLVLSTVEFASMYALMSSLFKLPFKANLGHIFFASVVSSYISYTMVISANSTVNTVVSGIMLFLFAWFLFQIPALYAIMSGLITFLSYGLVQAVLILLLAGLNVLSIEDVQPVTYAAAQLQICTAIVINLAAFWINRRNIGFDIVPENERVIDSFSGSNKLIIVILVIVAPIAAFLFNATQSSDITDFLIFIITLLLSLILLFSLVLRKEKEY